MKTESEGGFTLIELLTVVAIIGVLATLGATSFSVYRTKAYYAMISQTYEQARTAMEAGINNIDSPPGLVPLTEQKIRGSITDGAANALLPALKLPPEVAFQVSYDPDCLDAGCTKEFIQVNHCKGEEYIQWSRLGNGIDVLLENLSGIGCP